MRSAEKQLLLESETKLEAVQNRLDWYESECFNECDIPKSLVSEFYRLLDLVQGLKKELDGSNGK